MLSRLMRLKAIQTQTNMTTTTFSSPTTGRLPHPLLALAGAVVTDVSKHFGVYCLPVVLFLVLPPYGGVGAKKTSFWAGS